MIKKFPHHVIIYFPFSVPSPDVSISLSSSISSTSVVAGTTAQVICTALLPNDVDTPVNFNASWNFPNRTVFDQSDSVVSSSLFRSVLTLSLVTSQDQGGVVCSVVATPNSMQEHVLASDIGEGMLDVVVNGMIMSNCKILYQ